MGISKVMNEKFPATQEGVYANTATSGLMSEDLLHWRRAHDTDFLKYGSGATTTTHLLLKDTRQTIADFFNFTHENVALVPSFSQGINLLLEGLDGREHVLLLEGDYPSLNWPFESRGYAISYVSVTHDFESIIYETIKRQGCTIFACSAVQWLNGFKIDFDFLRTLKSDFPDLLIIMDGTQFCGTGYFDFDASAVDVLGASGYKWLLAGYGNAFLMIKPEVQHRFELRSSGYGSSRNAPYQKDGRLFCKKLEPGHLDSLSFGSLNFSMRFLMDIGLERIERHNQELSQYFRTVMEPLGLLEPFVSLRNDHGTMFNIKCDDVLYGELCSKNVVCAQRGDGIRLGFHFYNTISNVNDVLTIVKNHL